MPLDWDKLRVFRAVAEAGSLTHAGDTLGLSQSAVSRQVSGLEGEIGATLFHRHARGLVLTEQGELLYRAAKDVSERLSAVKTQLVDAKSRPTGELRITTTVGLGSAWLTPRIKDFVTLYPDINLQLLLSDNELDIAMREADVAIRLRQPVQPELIQRKLFTVHLHLYASPEYLKSRRSPRTVEDLKHHRLVTYGDGLPNNLRDLNWLESAGMTSDERRPSVFRVNNLYGLKQAIQAGIGIAVLPDYIIGGSRNIVQINLEDEEIPSFDTYFVYAAEMRNTARIQVFRDFLLDKAKQWRY